MQNSLNINATLTAADLALIRSEGAPSKPAKELVRFLPRGQVFLTDRGVAFYREAARVHSIKADVEHIATSEALMELTLNIRRAHREGPSKPAAKRDVQHEGNVVHLNFGGAYA